MNQLVAAVRSRLAHPPTKAVKIAHSTPAAKLARKAAFPLPLPLKTATFPRMRCPFCDAEKERLKVIDSRGCDGGRSIRRRRECLSCTKRFTTYERVETTTRLTVVKKDGRRVPWDRNKILTGLERACFKRPVPENEIVRVVDEVEEETFKRHDREAPVAFIGQLVADKLRRLDQVAYVRFASVYRQFKTLEELVDEAKAVLDARRYEDPDQGSLFIDPRAPLNVNGEPSPGVKPTTNGKARRVADGDATPRRAKATQKKAKNGENGTSRSANPSNSEPAETEIV